MKRIGSLAFMLLVCSLMVPLGSARADAAPPMNPPGGDVSPEGGTQVQMTAEQVTIDLRQYSNDNAAVSAWFLFHNTSDEDEHLKVRFPLNGDPRWDQTTGNDYFPLTKDFVARVNGQVQATKTVEDTDTDAAQFFVGSSMVLYWAVFEMDFPAGKDVRLTVSYTLQPTEDASYADYYYLLATGAGWKGPIGKADINVYFPYILNELNLPDSNDFGHATVFENQIRYHYENLEPTQDDNIGLWVVQPHLWQEVVRWRANVISQPNDPASWEALARAYAATGQEHHGAFENQRLADLYVLAAERAAELNPNDLLFHLDFAETIFYAQLLANQDRADYFHALFLDELAAAARLDPQNPRLDELLQYAQLSISDLPQPGPFPSYSASTATFEPTDTPILSTPTLVPMATDTDVLPTRTSPPAAPATAHLPNSPVLIAVIGLLLVGAGFIIGWLVSKAK
ncbi:MAG TPA: hypothetical protein VMC09_05255 [Anaerolineales bacterium]|nr:hypothetical protein [Anaerolineales bacterium]